MMHDETTKDYEPKIAQPQPLKQNPNLITKENRQPQFRFHSSFIQERETFLPSQKKHLKGLFEFGD